jgi:hypothetical protein
MKAVETNYESEAIMESTSENSQKCPQIKSGTLIRYNGKETYLFIDAAISGDRNLINQEAEKF